MSLRKKIISGNLVVVLLIVIVGGLSIMQFVALGNLVAHVTGEVAGEVKIAGEIQAEILNMRTAVEKFISLNRESDRMEAEKHIANVNSLLARAKNEISSEARTLKLQQIETTAKEYIEKFNNVVIRIKARDDNKSSLFAAGDKIEGEIYKLVIDTGHSLEKGLVQNETNFKEMLDKKPSLDEISAFIEQNKITTTQNKTLQIVIKALKNLLSAKALINRFLLDYDASHSKKATENLNSTISELEAHAEYETMMYAVEDYLDSFEGLAAVSLKMNEEIQKTLLPLAPRIVQLAGEVTDSGWQEMNSARLEVQEKSNLVRQWIIGLVILSIIIGIAVGFFQAQRIIKPINRVVDGLTRVADQVASSSDHILSSSQELAQGASEQAASIEETSSSLEEMASMTKQNADNAGQADSLMKESNEVVGRANGSMGKVTSSMEEISQASEETSKIIKTIDEIAFQTNLLALNAAVEAARAGEQGAGFAVVADEVRSLAMRSAEAARNTADLIQGTLEKVKEGTGLVTQTNNDFTEVASSVQQGGDLVGEISASSREQAQGIDQVNKAVAEMDSVVQQNSANAEESAASSEEMRAQAVKMRSYVNELFSVISGETSSQEATADSETLSGQEPPPPSPAKRLPAADMQSTRGTSQASADNLDPEEVIPLDDDDLKDF
ncbi:MAG: methyl-accepting chemotaxis protein [Deltaproteobacteria bacterium]|nr:methyl-accepting chemotaxis protein [Deltaproteobacteria bacterium]